MDDKVYFQPGDTVMLKQNIDNKPTMIVKSTDKTEGSDGMLRLLGITCVWFNTHAELQQNRFSTKDLVHV